MAVPVLDFSETNTGSAVVTNNITTLVFASVDSNSNALYAAGASSAPVAAGTNSYEKWLQMHVDTPSTNTLSGFGLYTNGSNVINDGGGNPGYVTPKCGANVSTFVTPVATTSTVWTTTPPTTSGTALSFTAPANTVGSYSYYFGFQMQVAGGATGGNAAFPANWVQVAYTYS